MAPDSADPWLQDIPGVAAHRGGRNLGPENTIYGILEGLGAGATHLEVDVRGTADGHAVCHHDANAERTCREDAEIAELDLAEVRRLDPCAQWSDLAGIATGEKDPPRGMRPRHFRIPELADVLETFTGVPTILDIKDTAPVDAVVEAVEAGWQRPEDLLLGGFDDDKLEAVAAELDDVPRTTGRESAEAFFMGEPVDADAVVIPPEHEGVQLVEPEAVEMAHDQGIAFWVWTINEAQQARELFELGVDGVITDQPDKLVRERARWM
jgi:glycerophosphoryl diester phosphodiesterase